MRDFKIYAFMFFIFILNLTAIGQSETKFPYLPKGINSDTVVSASFAQSPEQSKKVYVKDELKRIKAKCQNKKLLDGEKRQIKFYLLKGCWGAFPPDAREIPNKQNSELAELRKKIVDIDFG